MPFYIQGELLEYEILDTVTYRAIDLSRNNRGLPIQVWYKPKGTHHERDKRRCGMARNGRYCDETLAKTWDGIGVYHDYWPPE